MMAIPGRLAHTCPYRLKREGLGSSGDFLGVFWKYSGQALESQRRKDRAGLDGALEFPGRSDRTWPGDGQHHEVNEAESVPGRSDTL